MARRKHRPVLAIALAIALAAEIPASIAAAHAPSARTAAETNPLSIERTSSDGTPQRLSLTHEAADGSSERHRVVYEEAGVVAVDAVVEISPAGMRVAGEVDATPYAWEWTADPEGERVHVRMELAPFAFEGALTRDSRRDAAIEDLARYLEDVRSSPQWPILERFADIVREAGNTQSPSLFAASLAAFGAGAPVVPTGPIGSYLACLRESCDECGGCWKNVPWADCYSCPGASILETVIAAACYFAATSMCLTRLPLPWGHTAGGDTLSE